MSNPKASIIIPVYNGADYMREAIDSALSQTYDNYEVIVVNDGSNDEGATRSIALSYGEKIRYFEKENGGVSSALNMGIEHMHGEYFTWLSHDDVYLPDRLRRHIETIAHSGDPYNVSYSQRFSWIPEVRMSKESDMPTYRSEFYESGLMAILLGLIDGCSITIHKSWFEEYGLFDDDLRTVQDYKKWHEMFRDKRLLYIDYPLSKSRVHQNQQGIRVIDRFLLESDELFSQIIRDVTDEDLHVAGLDLYTFLSLALLRFENAGFEKATSLVRTKLVMTDEPQQAKEKRGKLFEMIRGLGDKVYLYCMGRRGYGLIHGLHLRGIRISGFSDQNETAWKRTLFGVDGVGIDDIPKEATLIITKDKPGELVDYFTKNGFAKVMTYDDLMPYLAEVPIDKSVFMSEVNEAETEKNSAFGEMCND